MNAISNLRIAARIYDDIGDYHTADQLDQFVKEAGSKAYSPKDFMKALPIMFGMGALGNVLTPSPAKPPLEMQQMMEEQSVNDQYGEDSKFDIENYKAQAKPNKPVAKPQPALKPERVEEITESPKTIQQPVRPVREKPIIKRESPPAMQGPKGNFNETMKLMLNLEGGKTDESSDKGGRTNLGITQRTYNEWLRKNKRKPADVFNISKSTALQIYREGYWNVIKGDKLPHNVAKAMMSMALTDGPQDSVRFTQRLLGIEETGFMGPKTLSAIWAKCKKDDTEFTKNIMKKQILRYRGDEDKQYVKGWENRAEAVIDDID
jgi:hypothetical protein